jgi:NAD(P)-dependent dehydrogenase (short-subunit alcohol dehydrogenase family)
MDLELNGKVVLITGGSDGLGAAAARKIAAEGGRVAICARGQDKLHAVAHAINTSGGEALAVPTDVTRPDQLEHFVQAALQKWGRIDALVNNAGRAAAKPIEQIPDAEWAEDLDLKFYAAVRLSRLIAPELRKVGGGSIINVLATGGKTPGASSMPSSVSRAAGMALMKAMSKDLGKDNIRVNGVLIGFVESDQWHRMAAARNQTLEQVYAGLTPQIPLGRVGQAEEFADLVAFLVSNRGAFISGCAINFDGGMSAAV